MPQTFIPSTILPNGFDYAIGTGGLPGTPTSSSAIAVFQSSGAFTGIILEEDPNSPEIELAEQATVRHTFTMDWVTALIYLTALVRGTLLQDTNGNITKILSSTVIRQKGNLAKMIVVAEGISFGTPPDLFRLEVTELNPALEKHPNYAFLPADIRNLVNNAVSGSQIVSQNDAINLISTIKNFSPANLPIDPDTGSTVTWTWQIAFDAAKELLLKRRIGEDTFYLPGFRITWTQYFFAPPYIDPGGYIQDPILNGGLPMYFWNPQYPLDPSGPTDNIFALCARICPTLYADDNGNTVISWLKLSDNYDWERTWFRVTHTWIGAPYAHWDGQLYTRQPRRYPKPPSIPIST